jgi:hypothetical protein
LAVENRAAIPQILDVLERVLPNCERVTIREAFHMMYVEQAEQFNP